MSTIFIASSHGLWRVNIETGEIDAEDKKRCRIPNYVGRDIFGVKYDSDIYITKFDMAEWKGKYPDESLVVGDTYDILDFGYDYIRGLKKGHEEPDHHWRKEYAAEFKHYNTCKERIYR